MKMEGENYIYIDDSCVNCGACVPSCPCPGTIVWDDSLEHYRIRWDRCKECGCSYDCFDVCPVEAIKWTDFIET